MKVALIQEALSDDRATDADAIASRVREAAQAGSELVVLSELHGGHYFCQSEDTAQFDRGESIPGPTTDALGALALECGVVIVGSVFERRAPGLYHNTAVVLERDGSLVGRYRKMHIPDDPGFYEKFYFTPGDLGFHPIETSVGKLGVLVCWDQWYPEAARLMALSGADVLIYPTAIGWDPRDTSAEKERQRDAWVTIQRSHAVANGLTVISVNRVGHEPDPAGVLPGTLFWGTSFVAGPQGELLFQATDSARGAFTVEVDLGRTEVVRRIWPFLRDRRIDAYGDLTRRYRD